MRGPEGASVQQCTGATRHVLEPLAKGEGEVAGLLHCPVPGRVRGDAAQVHPAGTVLDEHQHVHALQQHGVHVQEIDREDPGGLGCQELPARRARPARRRVDARGMRDLPHGGRRNCHAELHELAVDPPVSPHRILPCQANDKASYARACLRAPWPAALARVVLPCRQPAVPGQQRRGRNSEDTGPPPARYKPRQCGEPDPVTRLIPHPTDVPPQYRVLMPEHQQFSIFHPVAAEHQDGQAEYPARKQVDDLEQHPAS
jgi:hypothetical protein